MNKKRRIRCLLCFLIAVGADFICDVVVRAEWIDTRYTDFQQGTYDAEIYISRRLQTEVNPADSGCIEYHARFNVNNDGWYDLVSADNTGPNLTIWLGSVSGYSASNCLTYPITSGGNCDISDLNLDGYPELIHSGCNSGNLCIYWGTVTGPSATDTTQLPNGAAEAVYVADFDKDTYLDIAVAGTGGMFYIYWGSLSGYSTTNRLSISLGGMMGHNIEASDLDKNGLLDIIITTGELTPYDVIILYQTSPRNFTPQALDFADTSNLHGLSIGDLNVDGYVDIVATGLWNITYSSIYWGSASGYSDANKLNLNPGQCYGGSAVADFNSDSLLDILYYRGANSPIAQKPIIYYNSGSPPFFSDADTHEIGMPLNATGGTVADFNRDGYLDAFVNNYLANSYSYVFYGPDFNSYDSLPVNKDHHGTFREPRQIPSYYSRVVAPCTVGIDTLIIGGNASWIANLVGNSKTLIYISSGNTQTPDTSWTDWYEVTTNPGTLPTEVTYRRYIQYRAKLWWENPAELPNLEQVKIDCNCGPAGIEEVDVGVQNFEPLLSHNPATNSVTISYTLPSQSYVKLLVYNITGNLVETQYFASLPAGSYTMTWDLRDANDNLLPAGIYFLTLNAGNLKTTKKLTVIR